MYSNYEFYKTVFRGELSDAEYQRRGVRAAAEIDRMTFGRAKTAAGDAAEAVMFAECAVIDELSYQAAGGSGDVISESNDGISRSYATGAAAKSARQRIDAAASTWLCRTDLCAVPV